MVRRSLPKRLKSSGVDSVHYVYTALQAFMYPEEVQNRGDLPRLIVTDMHLPVITGQEFLTDLKTMEPYQHILVIVLSTTKSLHKIEQARQLGALDYLVKPFTYA